ncbi:V-type ATPase subunit [Actinospica sp. MGRD01-02]|uniref:V-type ATPase subunit n=1 Tax=Actinospica acidithermotolerans TaxID=2828514 RepID=A0A941ED23_9ACTN|nr:V-type ATPase subunit [Actinospica acidithermotolerans]MBR7825604.1 V-type ATPase subunit [Actinospica acidithermotolerans]
MSAGWVAATVRARALLERRIGSAATGNLAAAPTFHAATVTLAGTAYRRFLPEEPNAAQAERAVDEAVLWNLRVLAGWLPRSGAAAVGVLVADYEIRNIADRLRALAGAPVPAPYRLGSLSTAWREAAAADSVGGLRRALGASAWGDPGVDDAAELVCDLRLRAAQRLADLHEACRPLGVAACALGYARQRFLIGRRLAPKSRKRARTLLGERAAGAESWQEFAAHVPKATAGWVLEGIEEPRQLWRAEERWWSRAEQDAGALARASRFDLACPLGCALLLLVDARAVRGAVNRAARGADGGGGQQPTGDDHGAS